MNTLNHQNYRLTPEHLNAIRANVDWHALFSGVGLKRVDAKSKDNDWWSLSPFTPEKTASFHMGPGGIWYDFSISEGGGAIELIQKLEDCNCFEAGHILLDRGWTTCTGVHSEVDTIHSETRSKINGSIGRTSVSKNKPNAEEHSYQNQPIRQNLLDLCTTHEMLEERGIGPKTCELLGIGYLPQGRSPLKNRIIFQVADARVTAKSDSGRGRVILSHLGRAVDESQDPKYLFYEGFHKSDELYGQELIWLHEDVEKQIQQTSCIVLTEGPFDVAKAVEAGLRNVVGSFGASLSDGQAAKLKEMSDAFGTTNIRIVFDRDEAGRNGAKKAAERLQAAGLNPQIFDWNAPIARCAKGDVFIPKSTADLADFTIEQLSWLRAKKLI